MGKRHPQRSEARSLARKGREEGTDDENSEEREGKGRKEDLLATCKHPRLLLPPPPTPHPRVKGMEEADARLQEVVASLLTEHGGNHEQALRQTFACLHNSGLYEAQSPAEEEQREQQVGGFGLPAGVHHRNVTLLVCCEQTCLKQCCRLVGI